jgi:hypothetical protein
LFRVDEKKHSRKVQCVEKPAKNSVGNDKTLAQLHAQCSAQLLAFIILRTGAETWSL